MTPERTRAAGPSLIRPAQCSVQIDVRKTLDDVLRVSWRIATTSNESFDDNSGSRPHSAPIPWSSPGFSDYFFSTSCLITFSASPRISPPVGVKSGDGKVYLRVGNFQAVNAELADYGAKIVTIKGKQSIRDGFAQLQIEEIRKL